MAKFVAVTTGNWSNTASWGAVRNTETIHASTNITVTGGGVTSATFTAPDTSSSVLGVLVYISAVGTAGTLVATLQENSADTAATVSLTITSLKSGGWVFMKLATPYVYTATTAGYYRWKLNTSGASGTTSAAANSGGTNFAYASPDNLVAAVPTTNDDIYNGGNNLASLVITVDDTSRLVGSGTGTGAPSPRNTTAAINLSNGGAIAWSAAASSTLEARGQIEVAVDGEIQMGTVATPIPAAYTAKLITDQNGTPNNYDLQTESAGKWKMQGASRTYWKTTYASGAGTAADPLLTTDAVDWNVGDEFCITGQGAYNQHERRFIITKNSSTSYVVSTTAGGGEAAFTYAHDTDDRILLLTRNVVITSKTTTEEWAFTNKATTDGYLDCDWARVEYVGGVTALRRGWGNTVGGAAMIGSADYFVVYLPEGWGFSDSTSTTTKTYTGIIAYGNSTASNVGAIVASAAKNKTYTSCYAIGNNSLGFYKTAAANITLNQCEAWNNNANNQLAGGLRLDNSSTFTITDFVCQANRTRGIYFNTVTNTIFDGLSSGNFGTNTIDIDIASDTYADVVLKDTTLSSATTVNNYLNLVPGSIIAFDRYASTDNRHIWYTAYGTAQSTGAALADTTVRTASSLALRLSPEESTTGFVWEYKIAANAGRYISASGFIKKNAAFSTDDVVVSLFLPGSSVADATYTMPDDTEWNAFNIGADYSAGTIDRYAMVRIAAISAAAAAYCYVDDLYNGTNIITAFDLWDNGRPSEIMFEQLGDAAAVWGVSRSASNTAGTFGEYVNAELTEASEVEVVDSVWDEATSDHVASGSTGKLIVDTKEQLNDVEIGVDDNSVFLATK